MVWKLWSFKPYYNWNTFNTTIDNNTANYYFQQLVLNLIITGIPSILKQNLIVQNGLLKF